MHQPHLNPVYTPERNAQGEVIGPQGGSSLCIYYATDNRGERWIIKGNPDFKNNVNYQEGYSCLFDELGTWQLALKEVLANWIDSAFKYFCCLGICISIAKPPAIIKRLIDSPFLIISTL